MSVNKFTVLEIARKHIKVSQTVCTDGLAANYEVQEHATGV